MKTKACSLLLIVTLLFAFSALGLAAEHSPFGRELIPLTEAEMEEIEGGALLEILVGGAVGGIQYLITTNYKEWNVADGLKHMVSGALGAWAGSFF